MNSPPLPILPGRKTVDTRNWPHHDHRFHKWHSNYKLDSRIHLKVHHQPRVKNLEHREHDQKQQFKRHESIPERKKESFVFHLKDTYYRDYRKTL